MRRIKEGTSAVLLQTGLDEQWWADLLSVTPICETFKISCLMGRHLVRGDSENRLVDPLFHLGAMVECRPLSAKDLSRLHQFGPKVLPGLFLGNALHAVTIWNGDVLVADIEALEKMDASEIHARRLNAKEVLTPM